ncbi:hypothetical protein EDD85DRAFT_940648 [Armillaria nabsnona]|nr:hypothetical protein EDD85DRAFT_940648 [Armillaria nabsnona]
MKPVQIEGRHALGVTGWFPPMAEGSWQAKCGCLPYIDGGKAYTFEQVLTGGEGRESIPIATNDDIPTTKRARIHYRIDNPTPSGASASGNRTGAQGQRWRQRQGLSDAEGWLENQDGFFSISRTSVSEAQLEQESTGQGGERIRATIRRRWPQCRHWKTVPTTSPRSAATPIFSRGITISSGALIPPISLSTTFAGRIHKEYNDRRSGNPTMYWKRSWQA